jgi:precorrin-6B C5,15-methyltransferase / cobalt-precorrin-6B C5,C15-methyltransferase
VAQDAALMPGQIVVVGIGADGIAGLSAAARAELAAATVVYGSQRQLDLLGGEVGAQRCPWPSPLLPVLGDLLGEHLEGQGGVVHVLASGDPMLHGIGTTLIRLFGTERVRVLPSVSCVTLACARMGWPATGAEVISLVNAAAHTAVRRGGRAVVLSRDGSTPVELARLLTETGRGESELTVLEQLGGPGERHRGGTASDWVNRESVDIDPLNVIAVQYQPDDRTLAVLPDSAYAHDGQITKQAMRAVTLAALAPRPGELLWDVGSGSGSIAIEWSRVGNGCRAVAFERDEQRRTRIADNSIAFGAGVEVRGAAPQALTGAPEPAVIFIGGGLTQPGLFDACLDALPDGGRLVANAVTAESEAFVAQRHCELGGELARFQHYLGEPLGSFTGWRPAMPVTQWTMVK